MTSRYGFLTTPRWYGIIAGAIVLAIVCSLLGYWQWTRYADRAAQVALVQENYDQAAVDLDQLVPDTAAGPDARYEWRPVQVTGQYAGRALILPQRGVEGSPADHVVGLLRLTEGPHAGQMLLIDRGWYQTDTFADHSEAAALPEGEVDVVLRLRPAEEPAVRDLEPGQIHRLNPAQAAAEAGIADGTVAEGLYGQLASESAAGVDVLPTSLAVLPRPSAHLGSHLSYALQWWVFALGSLGALVLLARREAREASGEPAPRRASDDEDADIDAQLQANATSSA